MYLIAFPLLLIPFALYNMIAFLLSLPFTDTLFSIPLLEGRRLPVTTSDDVNKRKLCRDPVRRWAQCSFAHSRQSGVRLLSAT